jgi:hypothetical protein
MRVDAALLKRAMELPYTSSADVAHINAKHRPPWGQKTAREYRDGCVLTPVYPGCRIYSRKGEPE